MRIVDPIESMLVDTYKLVGAAEQNYLAGQIITLGQKVGGSKWLDVVAGDTMPVQVKPEQLAATLADKLSGEGMVFSRKEMADMIGEAVTVWAPNVVSNGKYLSAMVDGKRVYAEIHDEGMREMLNSFNPKQMGLLVKLMSYPARALRATATATLLFAERNVFRDTLQAMFYAPTGYNPLDLVRGFLGTVMQDEDFKQMRRSRGSLGHFSASSRTPIQKRTLRRLQRGRTAANVLTHVNPFEALFAIREIAEKMNRVGMYKRLRRDIEKGNIEGMHSVDDEVAQNYMAFHARDVLQDFNVMGANVREIAPTLPFFAARIGGLTRAGRAFTPRDAPKTAARVGVYMGFAALLWGLHKDDDEYEAIPGDEKQRYHHIPIPQSLRDEGSDAFIRVPRPFEYGDIANVLEGVLDMTVEQDPNVKDRMPFTDLGEFGSWLALTFLPLATRPAPEVLANYDLFRRRPIVSPYAPDDVELQFDRHTSETMKWLAPKLGMSPQMTEHVLFTFTAGIGRMTLDALDTVVMEKGAKKPTPAVPYWWLGPGAFRTGRAPAMGNVHQFFEKSEEIESAVNSVRGHVRAKNFDRAREIGREHGLVWQRKANGDVSVRGPRLDRVRKHRRAIKDYGARIRLVFDNPTMTRDEKRARLDLLTLSMVNRARVAQGMGPLKRTERLRSLLRAEVEKERTGR